jgi:hypothetical protein
VRLWPLLCLVCACTEPELQLPPKEATQAAGSTGDSSAIGRARAFRVEKTSDLLAGPEALGRLGDVRLENGKVAFIIDQIGAWNGFAESGGNLIDAAPLGGRDHLKQIFGFLADAFPRQPSYEQLELGREGDAAVVHAIGHDSGQPRIRFDTRYRLRPGSSGLEIATTVTNDTGAPLTNYAVGDAVQWGRVERFAPGFGTDVPRNQLLDLDAGWVGGQGDGVTYLYAVSDGPLSGKFGTAWSDTNLAKLTLENGGSATVTRWLIVGDGAGVDAAEALARVRKQQPARLTGHVVEETSGRPLDGVKLVLAAGDKPMTVTRSQSGRYTLLAPPGDYRVLAEAPGRRGLELEVSLQAGATTVDAVLSRPGRVAYTVTAQGAPSPAKITVIDGAGNPARFGPAWQQPGGNVAMTVSGKGELELAPGHWRLFASRGPEFTVDEKQVDVPDGAPTQVAFKLDRVVDLGSWWCADLHQHASPSPDSAVAMRDRAAANLVEGLEVMVATDHNMIADWTPVLAELAAARPLRVVAGDEATVDGLGHWNVYPLTLAPEQPHGGALDVRGKSAHQIVGALRSEERVVQVNHPRVGPIGYFNNVGFDPAKLLPADWEGGFDAVEVFSSKDVSAVEKPLADWFSLLDRGLKYTAVGGSDSHLIAEQEIGYPRTCITGPQDEPGRALVDALKRRREAFITNGPFVRVQVGNRGLGQLAAATRGHARLDIEVRAAPWVDVKRVEVFVNGLRHGKPIDVAPSTAPVRYKDGVDLKVNQDAYVVVLVRGDQPLDPVVSRRPGFPPTTPLAITNPIYIDRDLDGKYTPPAQWKRK